ncbi:AAA family ATPase [Pseudomarimonas arenosa]|uniref:RecF/RecN/SMC family protein n=1 Tax=Pseudomarimonas arenosa TaxID=2774145 RepID=A0AAW3ZHX6_9GAMM|nr:AAA family ATPase [Pseudomarimonas arenosa]MBD8525678.1 hypothetical protein [Pseudomarimonas arenosa]
MFEFRSLEVVHWDYWERFALPLDANIVTVVGPNGSGKTTLLDALRTLLTIDCAGNRDFKSYLRHNGKPFAWLRAVVGNPPGPTGARPFFPIMDSQATLVCRIQKKGGEWQRQYAVLAGDIGIEEVERRAEFIGLREYRVRLEGAGLSQAIRRVLTLEQGATDKLCQLPPRALLDLVFDVFGDKAVLEDYQRARNEQIEGEKELLSLNQQLSLLGISLQEAEARVRSYQERQGLEQERVRLVADILPASELAELSASIRGARGPLQTQRRRWNELLKRGDDLQQQLTELDDNELRHRDRQRSLETREDEAQRSLLRARTAHDENAVLIKQEARLRTLAEQQGQADLSALAADAQGWRQQSQSLALDEQKLRESIGGLQAQIAAWRSGRRFVPEFESRFRSALDEAGIGHQMLSEIVEVVDAHWQPALEALLAGYRHVVLLTDPRDRQRAWQLGETLRYKHFVVADRGPRPSATSGSMLEVVRFSADPPQWLVQQLDRVQRVESVDAGRALERDQEWITAQGYFRERRGGRFLGVDDTWFGHASLERQRERGERQLADWEAELAQIQAQRRELSQRISDAELALRGNDALSQLTQRSEEFAEAQAQHVALEDAVQRLAASYAELHAELNSVREERSANARRRDDVARRIEDAQRQHGELERDLAQARQAQAQRVLSWRKKRRGLPSRLRSREALAAVRSEWETAHAVQREIQRLELRLSDGHFETDEQVVALRDKLAADHAAQKADLDRRAMHLERGKRSTDEARGAYLNVLRATLRAYTRNLKHLAELAGIGVEVELPELANDDLSLAQSGLIVRFEFDQKGWIGLDDGEASGGQQVMKSLLLLVALMRDESRPGGFVFIDEPFAHLDIFNIDKVSAFLKSTRAQYILTTPVTHNVNVFQPSELTLVTSKRRPGSSWAQPVAVLRRRQSEAA